LIEELLRSPAPRPALLPPLSPTLSDDREVAVLVSGPNGMTDPASFGTLSELRRWGSHVWPSAVWVGRSPGVTDRAVVARAGAARGYRIVVDRPYVGSGTVAQALKDLITTRSSLAGLVVPAHAFGREVGGQLAARCSLGLTGDAVGFSTDSAGALVWRKPAFGGGLVASIRSRTRPSLSTVRPGALVRSMDPNAGGIDVEEIPAPSPMREPELLASGNEHDPAWGDLRTARIVLTVGMGLGGPENLPALQRTLSAWKAALGGTRRVIDAGWLPGGQQVGLTGCSVAADLAVLLGVGGAGNHLIGLRRTRVILAVNPDRTAPVFERVDVGIVGGWAEVLPRLTDRLTSFARARAVATE
jgi:electron transfer flavoprotein alpha subunit